MSRSLQYIFPATQTDAVCKTQTLGGAGNLILNGVLSNSINNQVIFLDHGYSRNISLTSVNNLAAVNITITGSQNGKLINEVIAGPNANIIYSNEIFDIIYSINANNAVNAISIGTGLKGFFPLININLQRDVINYSFSTFKLTAGSIDTSIYAFMTNIFNNNQYFIDMLGLEESFELKASAADDQYLNVDSLLCNSILCFIDGQAGQENNSIQMNFLQT